MALNKNFRTTYYKTLGVPVVQHIVDVEASYAALFNEQHVVNLTQLMKLALEFGIAPTYRRPAWQLLSGIYPMYRSLWECAAHEKQLMYLDIVDASHVLQVDDLDGVCDLSSCEEASEQNETDRLRHLAQLQQIYWCSILVRKPLRGMDDKRYLFSIVRIIMDVLPTEMERFWCFVKILEVFHESLELLDPAMTMSSFYEMSVADLESAFVRALDVIKTSS